MCVDVEGICVCEGVGICVCRGQLCVCGCKGQLCVLPCAFELLYQQPNSSICKIAIYSLLHGDDMNTCTCTCAFMNCI